MIYVVKHKDYDCPLPEGYKLLEVGELFKDYNTDNINELNPYINELTGLYWIWKNTNDDFVGLCHYRRYFTDGDKLLTISKAKEKLSGHDILVAAPTVFNVSLYDILRNDLNDWQVFSFYQDIFFKAVPGFEDYLKSNFVVNPRNMFFCRKDLIDSYCEWLFPIVIPIAKQFQFKVAPSYKDNPYNTRMIGFFAERLMSYWFIKANLDCVEVEYCDI